MVAMALLLTVTSAGAETALPSQECIRLKRIEFSGNTHFSSARLKLRLKSWSTSLLPGKMNCLNEEWLKQDIKDLITFYRAKHYANVSIETQITPTPNGKSHILGIFIQEGPRYDILFSGNTFFSSRQLKKEIILFEKGDPNGSGVRKGRSALRKKYRDAGFPDVDVKMETQLLKKEEETIKQVTYVISQGRQMVVKRIDITGNQWVEIAKIRDAMITRPKGLMDPGGFNADTLKKDLEAISLVYVSQGFLSAKIARNIRVENKESDAPDTKDKDLSRQVFITVQITEGPQTLVKNARISGLDEIISRKKALSAITLSTGKPFRDYMVKSDANVLAALVSEKGYPHVKVTTDTQLNQDKTQADITWQVIPGPFTRFGNVRFTGNQRLKQKTIERKVNITPGDPFSLKKLFQTQKRVREIYSVDSVKITAPGLKTQENQPDIEITVSERKPYYVEAAAGYDTENESYLKIKTGDTDFMGRDMNAWVEGNVSGIGHQFEAGVRDPFFLDTSIAATFTIYQEDEQALNQDFGTRSWGADSGFTRELITHLTAGANFKYENRIQYGGDNEDEEETRNILITSTSLAWDNRDSPLKPSKGFLSFASVDLFTGLDSDLDRFFKYQLDIRHYRSPFKGLTFAMAGRVGYIQPLGSGNTVAEDQLFFLGGISDVRGFRENMLCVDSNDDALGGRTSLSASVEARIDLPANFELAFFLDTGKIDDTDQADAPNDFRYALGTGVRYITPIGPIGLLYGHKLNPEEGESPGQIHFSIGYSF